MSYRADPRACARNSSWSEKKLERVRVWQDKSRLKATRQNCENASVQGMLTGNPPIRNEGVVFGSFQVDCSAIGMCEVLA